METTTDEFTSTDSESTRDRSRIPRLFILEMVLRNFKSYAGEQRVGPFHKRFSAVVGPNGSGKSNVIDAMLFVFGKRAKQVRSPSMRKRSGVVQMVKLAEKEGDSLEDVKNEAEAYKLKELSLLKWQEKATKLASEDTSAQMAEKQAKGSILEENLKIER
ncbi:structural maintenance of chromosome 3 [Actinidia rufa]|uniref:Structural maintenance of chromosome 3 n=1 Tax=Actinidia rufa TaxID=165716 RepID=A0A7J0H7X1_9ERIC|nr:structural maintenance of chromosome 3 [Actinidia rufa]